MQPNQRLGADGFPVMGRSAPKKSGGVFIAGDSGNGKENKELIIAPGGAMVIPVSKLDKTPLSAIMRHANALPGGNTLERPGVGRVGSGAAGIPATGGSAGAVMRAAPRQERLTFPLIPDPPLPGAKNNGYAQELAARAMQAGHGLAASADNILSMIPGPTRSVFERQAAVNNEAKTRWDEFANRGKYGHSAQTRPVASFLQNLPGWLSPFGKSKTLNAAYQAAINAAPEKSAVSGAIGAGSNVAGEAFEEFLTHGKGLSGNVVGDTIQGLLEGAKDLVWGDIPKHGKGGVIPPMQPRQRFDPALLPRIKSPEEMAVTSFLNTGSNQPVVSDEWDEEDWKIAALSDDPLGVREVYEQIRGRQDEQQFIQDISSMDWTSARAQDRLGELLQKSPRGATKEALDYLDVFRRLGQGAGGESEDDFFTGIAKRGTPSLQAAREAYAATGDKYAALAAADDADRRSLPMTERNALQELYRKQQEAGQVPLSEEEFGDRVYNGEKVAIFLKKNGTPPKTPQQWEEAHNLWASQKQREALEAYDAKRRLLEEERYFIPPSLTPQAPRATVPAVEAPAQTSPQEGQPKVIKTARGIPVTVH